MNDWVVMVVSLRPALRKSFTHTLHHVSITYRPPFQHISTSYCFRIVSVLFPLLEARTKKGREKEEKRMNEGRYGIDTGSIRDRYETDIIRPPVGEVYKKFNFFIDNHLYYILHFNISLHSASHPKMTETSIVMAKLLYKDNLPLSRNQVD